MQAIIDSPYEKSSAHEIKDTACELMKYTHLSGGIVAVFMRARPTPQNPSARESNVETLQVEALHMYMASITQGGALHPHGRTGLAREKKFAGEALHQYYSTAVTCVQEVA